jgi:tetratricopeptide (TPR) repeat protein
MGNRQDARRYWERSLELDDGSHADVHVNLGNLELLEGNVDLALEYYNKALNLRPNDAEIVFNLGMALDRKQNLSEAIALYHRARSLLENDDDQMDVDERKLILEKIEVMLRNATVKKSIKSS